MGDDREKEITLRIGHEEIKSHTKKIKVINQKLQKSTKESFNITKNYLFCAKCHLGKYLKIIIY